MSGHSLPRRPENVHQAVARVDGENVAVELGVAGEGLVIEVAPEVLGEGVELAGLLEEILGPGFETREGTLVLVVEHLTRFVGAAGVGD